MLVRSEAEHRAVTEAFRAAAEGGRRLLTTNYVLVESAALLQHRIGLEPVRDLDGRISPLLDIIWVSADLHRRAVERLFRTNRRHVSLVDAVSFTAMEAEGTRDVLALDADFASEGFTEPVSCGTWSAMAATPRAASVRHAAFQKRS